jgi:hypothetical protein
LDPNKYALAREDFHKSGGYNQFYFSEVAPARILSPHFAESIKDESSDELMELAQSAAVYGAADLMRHLLGPCKVNVNLTNSWGESLLVLCCKAGHIDILRAGTQMPQITTEMLTP